LRAFDPVVITFQSLALYLEHRAPKSKKPPLSLTRALLTWWPVAESNRLRISDPAASL